MCEQDRMRNQCPQRLHPLTGPERLWRRRALFSLLLPVAITGCAAPAGRVTPQRGSFTVLTYNLYADHPDYDVYERIIRASDADLVFLQEVTSGCAPTFHALKDMYPYQRWTDEPNGRGNAILSRRKLRHALHLPPRHGWHGAWLAHVETAVGDVQVLGVHLMPPLTPDSRFTLGAMFNAAAVHPRELDEFCDQVDFNAPLVVLGDFNEDEYGAATTSLERRGLRRAIAFQDLLKPTWRYDNLPLIARRLDHVYYSPDLRRIRSSVLEMGRSDHWPVLASFTRDADDSNITQTASEGGSTFEPTMTLTETFTEPDTSN